MAQLDRAADYGSETTHFACSHDFDGNKAKQRGARLRTILTFTKFSERYHIFRQKKTQKKHTRVSRCVKIDFHEGSATTCRPLMEIYLLK